MQSEILLDILNQIKTRLTVNSFFFLTFIEHAIESSLESVSYWPNYSLLDCENQSVQRTAGLVQTHSLVSSS